MRKDIGKKRWKWSQLGIKQGLWVKIAVYIFILKLNKGCRKATVTDYSGFQIIL